jgi:hypothetical protein
LLAHGQWFSPGTPASSNIKTGRHDIAEILLKVVLNTKNQSINPFIRLAAILAMMSVSTSIIADILYILVYIVLIVVFIPL